MTDTQRLIERYFELTDIAADATAEIAAIKTQLAQDLGNGEHGINGATVKVRPPNRTFNLDRAVGFLNDEQRALTLTPDPKKVKGLLAPNLLDAAMDPGTGNPVVTIS